MKEHIHTIPVLDALRAPKHCPFCVMRSKIEHDAVAFIMGPAYMEDDVRMETNRLGFCDAHLPMLYAEQNRLGLALMLHTFLQHLNKDTDKLRPSELTKPRLAKHLQAVGKSCYLCEKIDATFGRYMDTFFYLWNKDKDARELIAKTPGYCLAHFADMLVCAERHLNKAQRDAFLAAVLENQRMYMRTLETDIEWFTLKFDYRNADAPWKNAKDALPRVIEFLTGKQ